MTVAPQPSPISAADQARYARCLEVSERVRWDIDRDVIRGRHLDFSKRFLPEGLACTGTLTFLSPALQRLLNQVQGRTYAHMFGCVERFIGAKMLQITQQHCLGDQVALQALVRFTDEELKHQELFRRMETLAAEGMPAGYRFEPDANAVAAVVLAASSWAVLALTCHIELFTQVHYRSSMAPDTELSALYKDVFLFHWREESQHAILDELEWRREDARLNPVQRTRAVEQFVGLLAAVDALLVVQAQSDTRYFRSAAGGVLDDTQHAAIGACLLRAYRWQYIGSGAQDARFRSVLACLTTDAQRQRIDQALAPWLP